jgi:ribosomal protein S18 acetylase RimI-like enzyme
MIPMKSNHTVTIIDYSDDLKEYIKVLNYHWLQKYFCLEKNDIISLSNPKQEIIDKGGFIFYAKLNTTIVGTVSLLKKSNTIFELGKMAVIENSQGLGIGKKIVEHCISFAKQNEIKTLILYSNTKLEAAIYLYKKYGFNEIELESGLYKRANIKMELNF